MKVTELRYTQVDRVRMERVKDARSNKSLVVTKMMPSIDTHWTSRIIR